MAFLQAAHGAALWLNATMMCAPQGGCHWAMNSTDGAPRNFPHLSASLYYGTPGISIFLATLHDTHTEKGWDAIAEAALDHTVATLNGTIAAFGPNPGFYYGLLGIAFGLRASNASRERHRAAAAVIETYVLGSVAPLAPTSAASKLWNNTDVAHGVAGSGLYLLWAARHVGPPAVESLQRAADWLLRAAEPTPDGGLRWYRGADTDGLHTGQYFPTFCCGTTGVSFFLATLAQALPELGGDQRLCARLIDAAKRGAAHALSEALWINRTDAPALLLPHEDEGRGKHTFYLGWCGGPPGWARLFVALYRATSETQWLDRLAEAVTATVGLVPPALDMIYPPTPGRAPWANLGQCCGAAAAGTFLLRVATTSLPLPDRVKREAMDAARNIGERILQHSVPTNPPGAIAFPSAEEHAAPANTTWQAGWMQGAAGMAAFLLHLHWAQLGHGPGGRPLWPDEPLW